MTWSQHAKSRVHRSRPEIKQHPVVEDDTAAARVGIVGGDRGLHGRTLRQGPLSAPGRSAEVDQALGLRASGGPDAEEQGCVQIRHRVDVHPHGCHVIAEDDGSVSDVPGA